jgi:hypothetical protein
MLSLRFLRLQSWRFQRGSTIIVLCVLKSKSSPATRHGGTWVERIYRSYSFFTSALDGGEWSALRPGRALAPWKGHPVPTGQEAEWAQEPVWTQRLDEKSSASAGDRTPIAQSARQWHQSAWFGVSGRSLAGWGCRHRVVWLSGDSPGNHGKDSKRAK